MAGTALGIGLGVAVGLLFAWLALAGALLLARPRGGVLREVMRLLPDLLRLVARLAGDRSLPHGVRVRLGLLAAYLAMPLDLIPDFVPVLGYADDAIVVAWTLRSVARSAGVGPLRRHWPGTDEGFAALSRMCRLDDPRSCPSWTVDVALIAGFAVLTAVLAGGGLLGVDLAVRDWVDAHRPAPMYRLARSLNLFGQGSPLAVLALGLSLLLARRTRSVRAILPVVAAFVLTGAMLGPLKLWLDRAAPHAGTIDGVTHPEELFSGGLSYPSGHAANVVVWYAVIVALLDALLPGGLPARWRAVLRLGPAAMVCVATTYLGFHWVTDTVAGIMLGLAIERLLHRVPAWAGALSGPARPDPQG